MLIVAKQPEVFPRNRIVPEERRTMKKIVLLSIASLLAANAAFATNSVAVTAAAAMGPNNGGTACGGGMCGLAVTFDGASVNVAKVVDNTPAAEPIYRADFWFDPNTLSMTDGNLFVLVRGTDVDLNRSAFQVIVNKASGLFRFSLRAGTNSAGVFKISPRLNYVPACGSIRLQLEFEQSPMPATPGGEVTLTLLETENACSMTAGTFINTAQFHGSGINNSTISVDDHHLGAVGNVPAAGNISGTFYVDEHRAFRTLAP